MFSDDARSDAPDSDMSDSSFRFGIMFAELWHDWFEAMSEVAYQTHRTCEFLAENGGPSRGRYGHFDFRPSHDQSEGLDNSIDMDKLRQCLHPMDPMQAARVMHAVQMMQAMEAMLRRKRSRENEAERTAW